MLQLSRIMQKAVTKALNHSGARRLTVNLARAFDGGTPVSRAAAVYLIELLRQPDPGLPAAPPKDDRLTAREIDLLQAFASGGRHKKAARNLSTPPRVRPRSGCHAVTVL